MAINPDNDQVDFGSYIPRQLIDSWVRDGGPAGHRGFFSHEPPREVVGERLGAISAVYVKRDAEAQQITLTKVTREADSRVQIVRQTWSLEDIARAPSKASKISVPASVLSETMTAHLQQAASDLLAEQISGLRTAKDLPSRDAKALLVALREEAREALDSKLITTEQWAKAHQSLDSFEKFDMPRKANQNYWKSLSDRPTEVRAEKDIQARTERAVRTQVYSRQRRP